MAPIRPIRFFLSLLLFFSVAGMLLAGQNAATVRLLPPSAFPNLPLAFRKQLEARGCQIPQEAFDGGKSANNVIAGEFANKGQKDWAVLCSKGGSSSILVFWGKGTPCSSELRSSEDNSYLQGDGSGHFVYSRKIRPVTEGQLQGYADRPPAGLMNHQGIEDSFSGKGSSVFSCIEGKWQQVASAE